VSGRYKPTDFLKHGLDCVGAASTLRGATQRGIDAAHAHARGLACNCRSQLGVAEDIARADNHAALPTEEADRIATCGMLQANPLRILTRPKKAASEMSARFAHGAGLRQRDSMNQFDARPFHIYRLREAAPIRADMWRTITIGRFVCLTRRDR
jgi:hypothetical protein